MPLPLHALSLSLTKIFEVSGLASPLPWLEGPTQVQKATRQVQGAQHVTWEAGPGTRMFTFKLQMSRTLIDLLGGQASSPEHL